MLFSRSMVALALSLAMLLIGVNSQSGWLFWLAGLLLAALAVSWIVSLFQVRKLSLVRRHRSEAFENDSLKIALEVHNNGRFSRNLLEIIDENPCNVGTRKRPRLKPARKTLREQLRDPSSPPKAAPSGNGGRAALLIPRIEAGGEATLVYLRRGLRRGVYEDWPGFFYSEGILGLARHTSRIRAESRLVVLPDYSELGSFPLVDSFLHQQRTPQEYSSKKGAGIDYYGVREFRAGDPLRHVHWKTTARRGELVVKEFERETGTPLVILVDNRLVVDNGKGFSELLDAEARLAASVAHYAHYAGHPVTLAAFGDEELVVYEIPGFRDALRWLAALEPAGGAGLELRTRELWSELSPGCFLCCVTPLRDLDLSWLSGALPPMCHAAFVLVDPLSHNGKGSSGGPAVSSDQAVSRLVAKPPPGLFSISVYRKGDDLRECLERPSIIYDDSPPQGR